MELLVLFAGIVVVILFLQQPFKDNSKQHFDNARELAVQGDRIGEAGAVGNGCINAFVGSLIGLAGVALMLYIAALTVPPRGM